MTGIQMGWRSLALLASLALLGSGCERADSKTVNANDASAAPRASALASHYGSCSAFTADLRIIAKPVEAEMLSFSISLWADTDGRVRISGKKFNVHFLEGMVDAEENFTAVLVRDQAVVRGTLQEIAAAVSQGEAAGGAAFSELATITSVLRNGPLASATAWRWGSAADGSETLIGDLGSVGQTWMVRVDGMKVKHSTLRNADGEPLFSLRYTHEREFERLIRAQGSHLDVVGDDSSYLFRLQRFNAVPGISDDSMALNVPEDWANLSIDEFLQLLVAPE